MHLAETIQQKMATDQLHSLSDNELHRLLEQSSSSSLVIDPQDKHYTTGDLISDLITKDIVSRKQKRDLLKVLISDKYLFKNIDTPLSNDVFKRVFALRLIETLIKNDDQLIGFLLSDQIDLISVSLITYLNRETDYRGYLFSDNNAWLQTFTHTANVITTIIRHPQVSIDTKILLSEELLTKYATYPSHFLFGEEIATSKAITYLIKLYPHIEGRVHDYLSAWVPMIEFSTDDDVARYYNHQRFENAFVLSQKIINSN
ncbi:DUF2785 domain-containing protein [Brochothrix thermosphacta]|uniref:DUF2785 domain-containing protein n=1 Tax=Brochothrix thermosphacta TaxID=2756 RepID=UPI0027127272|nr:DUF2785 domain-containing protein [Brochothrix thermosphacta]MDO7864154.1 DUF2785 domain-containing protein [Brochothrix thermosphacta]